jgi:hypothetical protein
LSTYRIGTGAGSSSDRLEPAVDLGERGKLDAIVLECLGERPVAFGHRDRMANPVTCVALGTNLSTQAPHRFLARPRHTIRPWHSPPPAR